MLRWMHIRNFALMEEADIEFDKGFNAVTGETGAGKSVMMSGLKLLLGGRFDKDLIRQGETRCELSGEFSVPETLQTELDSLLDQAGVAPCENGTLFIRRVFTPSAGRIFINSSPAGIRTLADAGVMLADIHDADETHGLLKLSEQIASLDRFAGNGELLKQCRQCWNILSEIRKRREEFASSMPSAEEAESLRNEVKKIQNAGFHPGEDAEIESIHSAAANSREILETASRTAELLTESEDSVLEKISLVMRTLRSLERTDPEYAALFAEKCDGLYSAVQELSSSITARASQVELDEESFMALEERMHLLQTLKRKYGPELEDVLAYCDRASARIDLFENAGRERERLEQEEQLAVKTHAESCKRLSEARKKAASQLEKMLSDEILKLGFKRSAFRIDFSDAVPGPGGSDRIEFLFSANPGVPVRPLRQVASSGELSRVMLAMRTVLAESDSIPTLVFDEIDANIGGETAVTVAEELSKLACHRQIISISHLPQVAAEADIHFLVQKTVENEKAISSVSPLDRKGRIAEIARMLGGGAAAEKHAKALISGKHG